MESLTLIPGSIVTWIWSTDDVPGSIPSPRQIKVNGFLAGGIERARLRELIKVEYPLAGSWR